jgi:hypothetical protein
MLKVGVLVGATVLALMVAGPEWSSGSQSDRGRDSLRGIRALAVAVENTSRSGFDLSEETLRQSLAVIRAVYQGHQVHR